MMEFPGSFKRVDSVWSDIQPTRDIPDTFDMVEVRN